MRPGHLVVAHLGFAALFSVVWFSGADGSWQGPLMMSVAQAVGGWLGARSGVNAARNEIAALRREFHGHMAAHHGQNGVPSSLPNR